MRRAATNIDQARDIVDKYYGKNVMVKYNKGRNKIFHYKGKITQMYDNVFIITVYDEVFERLACSYTDILCGEVAFKEMT